MRDFLVSINSLYWWLSVVLVGILINLFSAYLKTRIDTNFLAFSSIWSKWSASQKAQRQKRIDELRASPHIQIMLKLDVNRKLLQSIFSITLGAFLLLFWGVIVAPSPVRGATPLIDLFYALFTQGGGAVCLSLGFLFCISAMDSNALLVKALRDNTSDKTTSAAA